MPRRTRLFSNPDPPLALATDHFAHPAAHPPPLKPSAFHRRRSAPINPRLRTHRPAPPSTAASRPHTTPPNPTTPPSKMPRRASAKILAASPASASASTTTSHSPRAFVQVRVVDFVTSSPARHSPAENALGPVDVAQRPPCYNIVAHTTTATSDTVVAASANGPPSSLTASRKRRIDANAPHHPFPSSVAATDGSFTSSSLSSLPEPTSSLAAPSLQLCPQPLSTSQHQQCAHPLSSLSSTTTMPHDSQSFSARGSSAALASSDSGVFIINDTTHIDRLVSIVNTATDKDDTLVDNPGDTRYRRSKSDVNKPLLRPPSSSLGSEARNAEPLDLSDTVTETSTLLSSLSLSLSSPNGSTLCHAGRSISNNSTVSPPTSSRSMQRPRQHAGLPPLPPRGRRLVGERDLAACDHSTGSLSEWLSDPSLFVRVTSAQTLDSLSSASITAREKQSKQQQHALPQQPQAFVRRGGIPPFWQRAAPRPVKYTFKPVRREEEAGAGAGTTGAVEAPPGATTPLIRAPGAGDENQQQQQQPRKISGNSRGLRKAYPQRVGPLTFDPRRPPAPPKLPSAPHETGYAGILGVGSKNTAKTATAGRQHIVELAVGKEDEESFASVQRGVEAIDPRFVLDMAGGSGSIGVTAARLLRRRMIRGVGGSGSSAGNGSASGSGNRSGGGSGNGSMSGSAAGSQKRESDESAVSSTATEYYEDEYTKFIEKKSTSPLRLLANPPFPRLLSGSGESRVVRGAVLSRMEMCRSNSTISLSTSDEDYAPTPLPQR